MGHFTDMGAPQGWEIEEPSYYVPKPTALPKYPSEEAARRAFALLFAHGPHEAAAHTDDPEVLAAVKAAQSWGYPGAPEGHGWTVLLETKRARQAEGGEFELKP